MADRQQAVYHLYGKRKKRGEGNGVKPIKNGLMDQLKLSGWKIEAQAKNAHGQALGKFDAVYQFSFGPCVLEWKPATSHQVTDR